MKDLISNKFGKWFKSCGKFGLLRFRIMWLAYRLTGWHIRHKEWDFVLNYLPKLHNNEQKIRVLDVGCSRTLFGHELIHRGYELHGVDLEIPQEKYPGRFTIFDISDSFIEEKFDFVVCISVFEHIGNNGKGSLLDQRHALNNMLLSLKIGGRLIMTLPTEEFAQGHIWHGFTYDKLQNMLPFDNWYCLEYTERLGQICVVFERTK